MQEIIVKLTAKDDQFACAIADQIVSESRDGDGWYEYFDAFASLMNHPKSLVRNRAQYIPRILACLHEADLSKYRDSMRPLIEKDMAETESALTR